MLGLSHRAHILLGYAHALTATIIPARPQPFVSRSTQHGDHSGDLVSSEERRDERRGQDGSQSQRDGTFGTRVLHTICKSWTELTT